MDFFHNNNNDTTSALKNNTASVLKNTGDILEDVAKNMATKDGPKPSKAPPSTSNDVAKTEVKPSKNDSSGSSTASSASENISARFNLTDGKQVQEAFYMMMPQYLDDELLSDLRLPIGGSTDQKEFVQLNFCTKKGAIVPDNYTIKAYLEECLKNESKDGEIIDLYLKKEFETQSQVNQARVSDLVDAAKLAEMKRDFDEKGFKILTGTYDKHPAELEEKEWAIIAENNALCYGLRIVRRQEKGNTVAAGIERARYPAFRLKQRTILSDQLASSTVKDVKLYLRIPDYIIDDKSYVSIYETQSALQASLASSSFSEFDVSASASGAFFGCSVNATASYGQSSGSAASSSSSSSEKQVTVAYNFPRVTIFLDPRSLELTERAQAALDKIKDKDALTEFLNDYGEFFAGRVQLGGRLFASETVSSSSSTSTSSTKRSMRAAAAASFSGYGVTAAVNSSYQSQSAGSNNSQESKSDIALSWQANGGDSLLCNRPAAWCATVADFNYWRITKQDEGLHLVDFISKFYGNETLSKRVTEWKKSDIPNTSAKFFLNHISAYPDGRYLTADWPRYLLTSAIMAYQKSHDHGYPIPNNSTEFYSTSAAFLGPKKHTRKYESLVWQVEDVNGQNVNPVCYKTPYRLKRPSGGYINESSGFLSVTTAKGAQMQFISSDNKQKNGAIAEGALVKLSMVEYYSFEEDEKPPTLSIFSTDSENAYLVTSNLLNKPDDLEDAVLVFRTAAS